MRASAVSFESFAVMNDDQKDAALRLQSTVTQIISNLATSSSKVHGMSATGQLEVVEVVEDAVCTSLEFRQGFDQLRHVLFAFWWGSLVYPRCSGNLVCTRTHHSQVPKIIRQHCCCIFGRCFLKLVL